MLRQTVISTNIRSIGYENNVLEIEFLNGRIYQYKNVPREHFEYMITHAHPGTYFSRFIKDFYNYTRIS